MTRTTGACIRCQKNKIRVCEELFPLLLILSVFTHAKVGYCVQCIPGPDPAGWCANCMALSSRVLRMPCFRVRVTEAELFRRGKLILIARPIFF